MKKAVIGILAHVDAGKTTLAEAILYQTGQRRKIGRVDHGDTLLDSHALERERGITIFASQAGFTVGELRATLLDTPGHVDFSAETERMMQVMDEAILVISATDGVQAHTRTLWRLLALYQIPTFLFVTKMDFARRERAALLAELREEFGAGCIDFSEDAISVRDEQLAMCREDVLESYLECGAVADADIAALIRQRLAFPVCFGSGLRLSGVDEFLSVLERFTAPPQRPDTFGAKIFKISHDEQGARLTHMKITGGTLRVRDLLTVGEHTEKVGQIRVYNGAKFQPTEEISAGEVCAIPGLAHTHGGQGLGFESSSGAPVLEPVMSFRVRLPDGVDEQTMLPKLRQLEEEDPLLHVRCGGPLGEIHVEIMGEVQAEILRSLIEERFHVAVAIDSGQILYKETIQTTVEGVGHYEPLRHYAEVHLLLEPQPRGSGITLDSSCSENALERNWQRLILTHLAEKTHIGVLCGAPLTDVKITLAAGRAHLKHTEGGDFRQATYRAVRHGLMQAQSVLLEPYCRFRLEVPPAQIGRAITDIRARAGTMESPENMGAMMLLRGRAPVVTLNGYAMEVASYTGGQGRLICEPDGYDICHNADEVIAAAAYSPERDTENTPDSVFCAHGAGFVVKWDQVQNYMHLESCLSKKEESPRLNHRNIRLDEKELEALMEREFGPIKRRSYRPSARVAPETAAESTPAAPRRDHLIVDGYNVIFAWEDLRTIAQTDLEAAREKLTDILVNYSAFTKNEVILVFDAYNIAGATERRLEKQGVHIVYTRENETGDMYIERFITQVGKNDRVRVVTSDGLIQLSAIRVGVLRVPAAEFEAEVDRVCGEIGEILRTLSSAPLASIGEIQKKKNELE